MVADGPSEAAFVRGNILAETFAELDLPWPVDQVLATEVRVKRLFASVGLEVVSMTRTQHGSEVTMPELVRWWDRTLPFIEPAVPPPRRDALRQRYLAKAAAWLGDRSARWSPGTMHYVVARPATAGVPGHGA